MKLRFDSNQEYQLEAIQSIVDIFEGQPLASGDFEVGLSSTEDQLQISTDSLISNGLRIDHNTLVENVHRIQERNTLEQSQIEVARSTGAIGRGPREDKYLLNNMHFSVEMETGTGKTYVYLRTIHELHARYGFKKFVIVVPSIAIREGVLKSLEIMKEHFAMLYNNPEMDFYVWDSKKRGMAKQFATNNSLQIMVINIDSFARDDVVIRQDSDWGKPLEYIHKTAPIVIVDEPQNMETDKRRTAIEELNPLCTLRYSATHKNQYNLVYKLDPVKAYDLGLVKKIEVDSVFSEDAFNNAYLRVVNIRSQGNKITAKVEIDKSDDRGLQRQELTLKGGDDLYDISGHRDVYRDRFIIEEINAAEKFVSLSNGRTYYVGQRDEGLQDEIMKYQIRKTIQSHFDKEKRLKDKGIKVLSLFFIDKVSNYRAYSELGPSKGKFALWFEEIYQEFQNKQQYQGLIPYSPEDVHNGYFSQDQQGKWKDSTDRNGEGGLSKDDGTAYSLIMKDKERLMDSNTPLRFIFSHSALREGWDNPNVFQICTLNQTNAETKKRQEIGRGMRLCVNQDGERIFDPNINILTVIANESYDDFAKALQTEIETECGVSFAGKIKNVQERRSVQLNRIGKDLNDWAEFRDIWDRISQKTRYNVSYQTDELITEASKLLKDIVISRPRISNVRVRINMNERGVETQTVATSAQAIDDNYKLSLIPDILSGIQNKTKLTKTTIFEVLQKAGKIKDILINPQLLMDETSRVLNETLKRLLVDGIKYEKIAGSLYEMTQFENEELEGYLDSLVEIQDKEKTLYDHVLIDSDIEKQFAKDLEAREDVKFYFKLPRWFKIDTPIGGYNPDWAIVFEGDKKVYFVAETKGAGEIRPSEEMKIDCGKRHFQVLDNIRFQRARNLDDIIL